MIHELREAEIVLAKGGTTSEGVRRLGVTEQTFDRWREEDCGMKVDRARRPKELERQNSRLEGPLADAHLDSAILREASE